MRRITLGLAVATVAAVAASLVAWPAGGGSSPADELARRLVSTDDPDRFTFVHRAGGTRVLDCFLPNRQIAGVVDYDAALAVLRDATGTEVARKEPERVLLHRSLFAEGTVATEWVDLELPMDRGLGARLSRILGTELAGYVLTPGLPPSGRATALAALDAANRVDAPPATTIDGRRSDGFRITVDGDRFGDIAGADDDRAAPTTDVAPPVIDVWIGQDDRVRRVTVLPGRPESADDEAAAGWSVDYGTIGPPLDTRRPSSVTDAADVDRGRLQGRPATGGCEVPL